MPAAAKRVVPRGSRARQTRPLSYDDRPWLSAYPRGVPTDYDFPVVPVTRLLDDAAREHPGTIAIGFLGTRLTYRELREQVDLFASGLARFGVGPGDRVATALPNCPQMVIAFYAALRLGAVVVAANPVATEIELQQQLADAGAKVVVCLDKNYETVAAIRGATPLEQVVVTSMADYLPTLKRNLLRLPLPRQRLRRMELTAPVPPGASVHRFLDLMRRAGFPARQAHVDAAKDAAVLQYTGGTTGTPKGAILTHANLVANAYQTRLWLPDARPGQEITLTVLPLFHAYGLTLCMNTTVLLAGTMVLLPRFDVDLAFAAIEEWRPTLFPGVPPIYKALTDSPKVRQHDLRSIRACISGAMRLQPETQDQFERVTGGKLLEGYGMTETSPATHSNPVHGKRKPGTIGLPLSGTRCRIVDPDNAERAVPIGEPGELAIAGPQVFPGYWRRDTDGIFTPDGYVLTGDIAVMDHEGYFTIVDRKKEVIIAGGFNIYPSEVEDVIGALPGVADVAVIGVPDRYRGETVKAFVVLEEGAELTADDVREHALQILSAYKVPRIVEFRDALPHTPVGKVRRRVLLDEERAKLPANVAGAGPARIDPPANKRGTAKKAVAKRAVAKKAVAKKTAAKKAVAKKTAKKAPTRKTR